MPFLNDMLYNMSIQYGPTKEASAENLKKYFTIGEPRKNGFDLYKDFVAPPGGALQLQKLIKRIELQIEYLKFLRQFPEEQRSDLISSFFAVIDYLLPKQNDEN